MCACAGVRSLLAGCQVCARLERLASDLEAEAHPLLDAMTAKVTQVGLTRFRGRVGTRRCGVGWGAGLPKLGLSELTWMHRLFFICPG